VSVLQPGSWHSWTSGMGMRSVRCGPVESKRNRLPRRCDD
jgi:hypothetical protein